MWEELKTIISEWIWKDSNLLFQMALVTHINKGQLKVCDEYWIDLYIVVWIYLLYLLSTWATKVLFLQDLPFLGKPPLILGLFSIIISCVECGSNVTYRKNIILDELKIWYVMFLIARVLCDP